jgi:transposase
MIRIQLPQADVERLEQTFRSTKDRKLRDRLHIVLLAHRGRQHQDIAADLCINRRSVQRWLNAYLERGFQGLIPRQAKGAPAKIPADLANAIRRWVIEGPRQAGTGSGQLDV